MSFRRKRTISGKITIGVISVEVMGMIFVWTKMESWYATAQTAL